MISSVSLGYVSSSQTTLASSRSSGSSVYQNDQLFNNRAGSQQPIITASEASSMLSIATFSAQQIVDTVTRLASSSKYFAQNYNSGENFGVAQTNLNKSLQTIDQLANNSSIGTANILSTTSVGITIQSSAYGGKFYIPPQPMDVTGLNLNNLNLYTPEGRITAASRLSSAQTIAEKRLSSLVTLQNALASANGLSGFLRNHGAELSLGNGSLVNLTA